MNTAFSWFSPAAADERREAISSLDEYATLKTRYSPWDVDLEFAAIDLVFQSSAQGLRIYTGGFTSQELVSALRDEYLLDGGGEYRGVACWRYDGHETGWLGIVDGRVIISGDDGVPDSRAALEALIDTLTGNHRPSLTQHPDLVAIMSALDTDLNWRYTVPGHEARLPGVRATGVSYTITPDRVVRTRNAYAFDGHPRDSSMDIPAERDRVVHDDLDVSLVLCRENLLVIEAAAPLHTIINSD